MSKYLVASVGIAFSLLASALPGQVASGNVAESSHPRVDVLQAQNPHLHRSVEGCIAQQGNEYQLNAKHIGVIHLRGSSDQLGQHVGRRVKVLGKLTPVAAEGADEETPAVSAAADPGREMTVERIENISGPCPSR